MSNNECNNIKTPSYCVVIGGTNIDFIGFPDKKLIEKDSNPGKIHFGFGGVGRNIVENIARLGGCVTFITAIGDDTLGVLAQKQLQELNVEVIKPNIKNITSSYYMAINNEKGNMKIAICDNNIASLIDKSLILENIDNIKNAEYIILDTNLDESLIKDIFELFPEKKIICDGISTTKVLKLKDVASKIFLLKVNAQEYHALFENASEVKPKHLIVTNGGEALDYYCSDEATHIFKKIPVTKESNIISTTGAGDAMLGAIVYALLNKEDILSAISLGIKASTKTLESVDSVNKNINTILNN